MNNEDEWSDWIEHDGKGYPDLQDGVVAEVTERANEHGPSYKIGDVRTGVVIITSKINAPWFRGKAIADIIRYRIRKPRGMAVLESILADMPETIHSKEDVGTWF